MDRRLLDYIPEMEAPEHAARRLPDGRPIDADAEMAFGADLLEVRDRTGLEALLADLVARVGAPGRAVFDTPLGRTLVAVLGRAAQPLFPLVAGPVANAFDPLRGADLKTRAARLFGLELEGLSPEDKEFELARHFIRFAADAIGNATEAGAGGDPHARVQAALMQAARRHAPGLLCHAADTAAHGGRWQRQGNRIIVLNG
jgi:hypothetical protein